ncbi:hypothetical protein FRB99_004095 [Tulasnella sp. 403]|nr:hypothetical protein FRB99_004095 [Tulasnella sp. 403]
MTTEERDVSQPLDEKEKRYLKALHQKAEAERRSRPQETKPSSPLIQSLAVAFALDVPSLALLVVPSTYNIRQIVAEFRELGVDARPMDLTESSGGRSNLAGMVQTRSNDDPPTSTTSSDSPTTTTEKVDTEDKAPVLLISTLATTRGLDFPSLTHVFLLGPEVAKVKTDYDHVAGRVGRFAKAGKVVTFVEEPVSEDPTLPVPYDGERVMWRLYTKLGITPRKFDLDSYVV